jgi:6-phosphogluconolactonase
MHTECFLYIGTYTSGASKGIYLCRLNSSTGALTPPELAAEAPDPSFLAIHSADVSKLYAVNEVDFDGNGALSAFAIDGASGKLSFLNRTSSCGSGPCHLSVDATGGCLLAANFGSGSIVAYRILNDGSLGEAATKIQHAGEHPHAHWIGASPSNTFVFVCDLGLDKVLGYRFEAGSGRLVPNVPPFSATKPGAGPRHLAFHPNGRFAYLINEFDSTITAFAYDARRGALGEIHTEATLPAGCTGRSSGAGIEMHPSGKFVYGSNRGHDSIVTFSIDESSGRLTLVGHQPTLGRTPRGFAVDPTGQWLVAANQDSDNLVVFRIDTATGRLSPTGHQLEVGAPACVRFHLAQRLR